MDDSDEKESIFFVENRWSKVQRLISNRRTNRCCWFDKIRPSDRRRFFNVILKIIHHKRWHEHPSSSMGHFFWPKIYASSFFFGSDDAKKFQVHFVFVALPIKTIIISLSLLPQDANRCLILSVTLKIVKFNDAQSFSHRKNENKIENRFSASSLIISEYRFG